MVRILQKAPSSPFPNRKRKEKVNCTATTPFTLKEIEDLEKICGLHVNHLLLFMESVINQFKTQENVVYWNDVRHTFHCE